MVNEKIKTYIEKEIFPRYQKNDNGHNLDHIKYVIDRSFKFASTIPNININMVYVIASYQDIGHYIDAKNHEKASAAKCVYKDGNCPYNNDLGRMALRLQPAAGGDGTESRACF